MASPVSEVQSATAIQAVLGEGDAKDAAEKDTVLFACAMLQGDGDIGHFIELTDPANRNYSFNLLMKSKECVINIPTQKIAKKMMKCGEPSGKTVDKFEKFKLSTSEAAKVKAPLLNGCYASIECKLIDTHLANKYNLFILQGLKAWKDNKVKAPKTLHHEGKGIFIVAGKRIKVPHTRSL